MHKQRNVGAAMLLVAAVGGFYGCGNGDEREVTERPGEIINGIPVATDTIGLVKLVTTFAGETHGCSGTLLTPLWVLTAHHCLDDQLSGPIATPLDAITITQGTGGITRPAAAFLGHPSVDVALIKLSFPFFTNGFSNTMLTNPWYPRATSNLLNTNLDCYGYGTAPSLSRASLRVSETFGDAAFLILPNCRTATCDSPADPPERRPALGDSGGPCFVNAGSTPQIAGVFSSFRTRAPWDVYYNSAGGIRQWVEQQLFTPPSSMGGLLDSGPGITNMGAGSLAVFALGHGDGLIYNRRLSSGAWSPWTAIPGGSFNSEPAATSMTAGRLDVVARKTDNALYITTSTSPGVWSPWSSLGGAFTSGPSIVSRNGNALDVFAKGNDNKIYQRSFTTSGGWSGDWVAISSATFASEPDAVVSGPNQIDVVARKSDNTIHISTRSASGTWTTFLSLGIAPGTSGPFKFGPTISSWSTNRRDIFAVGSGDILLHTTLDGNTWTPWMGLGAGTFNSSPSATSWGDGRIDLTVRGMDNAIYIRSYAP